MIRYCRFTLLLAIAPALQCAQFPLPVALVTEAGPDATVQRADLQTRVPAYIGDLLFPGDSLLPGASALTISFCPDGLSYSLKTGDLRVEAKRVLLNGKTASATSAKVPCELPAITLRSYRDVRTAANRVQVSARSLQSPQGAAPPSHPETTLLRQVNAILKIHPKDLTALVTRAIELERLQDFDAAAQDYRSIAEIAPRQNWAVDQMRAVLVQGERALSGQGKTIAVVIGISQYLNLKPSENLWYADRDAEYFYDYLTSPRGGARPLDVALLVNEQATLAAINLAIDNAFATAQAHDRVVLFIAAHGVPVSEGDNKGAFIVAYDSKEEDPSQMYPMDRLQEVTEDRLRPHQVHVFVDACHSGFIGATDTRRENLFLEDFLSKRRATTEVLGLLASESNQLSYECSNLDQGHGAFTYFLVQGLTSNDAAVDDQIHEITVYSLFEYVRENVVQITRTQRPRQTPNKKSANVNDTETLAKIELPSLSAAAASPQTPGCDKARGIPPVHSRPRNDSGSLLDFTSQQAAGYLNTGQQVIVRYLLGEQVALTRDDFAACESSFTAASQLQGGTDPFTEARVLFCRGRKLIFDRQLPEARQTLEQGIRLDPLGAYIYNALGIAFLEASEFKLAIAAFDDAVRLAPNWAYARHNLALALSQDGRYTGAIATYRDAMKLGSQYSYIPFNLGLLYERLNRPGEAREAWRTALVDIARKARAWTAIGVSYSLEGRPREAESAYRKALSTGGDQTDRLAARHDLALLLEQQRRFGEALQLWRENLKEKGDDLPTLVGLSAALYRHGDLQNARSTFERLLAAKPEYVGARMQYAHVLIDLGLKPDAAAQLEAFLRAAPESAEACEMLADLRLDQMGGAKLDRAAVAELYDRALKNATSRSQRARIERKKRQLG